MILCRTRILSVAVAAMLLGAVFGRADEPAAPPAITMQAAKRAGPPDVVPVVVGGLTIETLPWGKERGLGQNGGYIAAIDTATGKEAWILKLYDIIYDPAIEADAQDSFITEMSLQGGKLIVTGEDGQRYGVDIATKTVTPL